MFSSYDIIFPEYIQTEKTTSYSGEPTPLDIVGTYIRALFQNLLCLSSVMFEGFDGALDWVLWCRETAVFL